MWPFAGGIVGILTYLLADAFELSGKRVLKRAAVALAGALYAASFGALLLTSHPLHLPIGLRGAAGVVAAAALVLLARALFVEVRPRGSARARGSGGPAVLVTTGSYALCRHPGVLWLALAHLSIALAANARELLLALPPWIAADILLAAIEDRILFPRRFGAQYNRYRTSTPFLVPTRRSIERCWSTRRRASPDHEPTSPAPADETIRRTT